MAKFCTKCGSPVSDEAVFCGACGADLTSAAVPGSSPRAPQQASVAGGYSPVPPTPGPYTASGASVAQVKSGSAVKVILVVVAVLFVCGLAAVAGVFYVAHRVAKKIQSTVAESGFSTSSAPVIKNACRLLSAEDVGAAIGVPIVATNVTAGGCEYLAKGTAAQMTAKHVSALAGAKGTLEPKDKDLIEKFAGGIFSMQQSEAKGGSADEEGNTIVFQFTIDSASARAQIKLNKGVMERLGPSSRSISGIGDEAFDAAGAMMLVRKGDQLIRMTYTACPCTTDAIEPLARKLADAI